MLKRMRLRLCVHCTELDGYVLDYGHRKSGTIYSIAQWRKPRKA